METFLSEGVHIAYSVEGKQADAPLVLVHGFASTHRVNWIETGWVKTLVAANRRVVMFDLRGHGQSATPAAPDAFTPEHFSHDLNALMTHLELESADIMGYSLGAMIGLQFAMSCPHRVDRLVAAGVGETLLQPPRHTQRIVEGLLAPSSEVITDPVAKTFRTFADANRQDRHALAACFRQARRQINAGALSRIHCPVLVVAGEKDTSAGAPAPLAETMPDARSVMVPRRDHMRTVGDKAFREAVLSFLDATAVP